MNVRVLVVLNSYVELWSFTHRIFGKFHVCHNTSYNFFFKNFFWPHHYVVVSRFNLVLFGFNIDKIIIEFL
jgi:hypothetical protein